MKLKGVVVFRLVGRERAEIELEFQAEGRYVPVPTRKDGRGSSRRAFPASAGIRLTILRGARVPRSPKR